MAEPINKAEYERLAAFRYALRQFLHFSETAARQAGISPELSRLLRQLADEAEAERPEP